MIDDRLVFLEELDVSRETMERLEIYETLLKKWNPAINLVAPSTLDKIWARHFLDSAATFSVRRTNTGAWLDLGSGGGFPGAVAAILAKEKAPEISVWCVEADRRKASFLKTLAIETGIEFAVISQRIEEIPAQKSSTLTARALAPLRKLLVYAERHLDPNGTAIFLKGSQWQKEVEEALETFRFSLENRPSATNPGSAILVIGDISRA